MYKDANIRDTIRPFMCHIRVGKHKNEMEQDVMTHKKNMNSKWIFPT